MTWTMNRHGPVAVLRLTRPPDNQLGFALLAQLDRLLLRVSDDPEITVVMLTGGVPGYFVAHADLDDVKALASGEQHPESDHAGPDHAGPDHAGPDQWGITLERLSQITQPVVAAVNGQAWGGGCELALACQLRILHPQAHFRFVEVAAGAIPGAGGTQRLPRLVGAARALRMVLSGEVVDAQAALAMGLADAVLPVDESLPGDDPPRVDGAVLVDDELPRDDFLLAALRWVEPIAVQPRHTLAAAKRAILDGLRMPLAEGLAHEQRIFRAVLASRQTQELFAAHGP
jgi:enoyl-CoA hydratase/carnithine racemase